MDIVNIILGILILIIGVSIIVYYRKLKPNQKGTLSVNLLVAGIGSLILGIGLIMRELLYNTY